MGGWRARANQLVNEVEMRLGRTRLVSRPVNVDVVLTKACGLACIFCKDYDTLGSRRVSLANFRTLARQVLPTARQLHLCSGGEPYLHKGLEDILREAKRYDVSTWLLSSGMIMQEDRVRTMVREGLVNRHGFSVDGFHPETVEAIRINAKLDVILENVRMLLRVRKEERKYYPRITINYTLMRSNVEELPQSVERWGEMGIDTVDCYCLSLANDIHPNESMFYHQELLQRVMSDARWIASRFPKLKVRLPPLVSDEQAKIGQPMSCRSPWSFVMIDANGQVLPCYRAFEALRLNTLYDDGAVPFSRIWNSKEYRSLRETVNDDGKFKRYPFCGQCENRYGWGMEAAHLGDLTWKKVVGAEWLGRALDHKRRTREPPVKRVAGGHR